MDHARLRGASVAAAAIDFGDEPPLSVDGEGAGVDRRRVSVQWFSGTILTGLCGAALMGGAVFAALDGETNFATVPERLETALRGSLTGIGERLVARKSDKLPTGGESNASRHVIRISTTARVGDREVVRVRPFVRVSSNLALSVTELSAKIPPFNAQKIMLADSGTARTPGEESAQAEPNPEVSFVTRELPQMLPRAKIVAFVPTEEVVARVRDVTNFTGSTPVRYASAGGLPVPGKLGYAAEGNVDPYAGFETRIVPENITMLAKTAQHTSGPSNGNEKTVTLKKGENVSSILRELGVGPADIKAVTSVLGSRGRDSGVKEGQRLRVLLSSLGVRVQPLRVIVMGETQAEAIVALSDMGKYVSVDPQSAQMQVANPDDEEEEDDGTGVRLYQSVYETALRNQIPEPVIEEMIRIYSYDVDFQRKTQPGDSFEVLYTGDDESGSESKQDVMFAALTVGGEQKKFYRFQTSDDGLVDYYDETGKSAKKFLVRKPLADGLLRSGFGARRHPILGYTKMHTGVDWAAPMGTPVYAAGSGTVEKAGWESGYGKYIRIRHTNGYETAYGHMTAFARGMEAGKKVSQGQLIGFVGSTGLSTGAHLHYEIIVNDRFVDPMRIKLPRGRTLEGPQLARFDTERDRLDNMMSQSPSRLAGNMR
ncbi:MAG TPA: peptidoglycan DD-metalloendopeptidase family protein [Xanthobacteraceae bacterium]|nr:peptidoglycan DD-metalloendopeptidase family protein [Xanthobacteraceae bacterium]